jgi:hypothetical protein
MSANVQITVGNETLPFQLDFESKRWTAQSRLPEGSFPLVAESEGKRFELYSDRTFAEVEF